MFIEHKVFVSCSCDVHFLISIIPANHEHTHEKICLNTRFDNIICERKNMISFIRNFCVSTYKRIYHHHYKTCSHSVTSSISNIYIVIVSLRDNIITISSYFSCRNRFCYYLEMRDFMEFFIEQFSLYFPSKIYFSFNFFSM